MSKSILPPDAFDEIPEWAHNTEPDDSDREEHQFPEFDEYRERVIADARYEREERFAGLFELAERAGAA